MTRPILTIRTGRTLAEQLATLAQAQASARINSEPLPTPETRGKHRRVGHG